MAVGVRVMLLQKQLNNYFVNRVVAAFLKTSNTHNRQSKCIKIILETYVCRQATYINGY